MKSKKQSAVSASQQPGVIVGLPQRLPNGAHAILLDNGATIAIANGESVVEFRITEVSGRFTAREITSYSLCGRVCALAESSFGVVVALEDDKRVWLSLLRDGHLTEVCDLTGTPNVLVASGAQAYLVVKDQAEGHGRLIRIDLRQRAIVAQRSLDHVQIGLSLDSSGQRLVLADRLANKVMTLAPGLTVDQNSASSTVSSTTKGETRGGPANGRESSSPLHESHAGGCCCVSCTTSSDGKKTAPTREEPQTPTGK
jgi:hypothetical protein